MKSLGQRRSQCAGSSRWCLGYSVDAGKGHSGQDREAERTAHLLGHVDQPGRESRLASTEVVGVRGEGSNKRCPDRRAHQHGKTHPLLQYPALKKQSLRAQRLECSGPGDNLIEQRGNGGFLVGGRSELGGPV